MPYHRISYTLDGDSPRFAGNPANRVRPVLSLAAGHPCNASEVVLFTHNGTHVDLPNHYHAEGRCLSSYALHELVFERIALVQMVVPEGAPITEAMLQAHASQLQGRDLLLLKTGWCHRRRLPSYVHNNPYLTLDAARYLRRVPGLRALGLDCISITNPQWLELGHEVHRQLLGNATTGEPIVIIEDLDLCETDLIARFQKVFVVPLFVDGVDGMPCTVFGEYVEEPRA